MLKCWESLEIHLDIWSPSEGTWSKAKDTPKNENDFIMRELSLETDWIVGTISQAEGAIINRNCRKLYIYAINEYINLKLINKCMQQTTLAQVVRVIFLLYIWSIAMPSPNQAKIKCLHLSTYSTPLPLLII